MASNLLDTKTVNLNEVLGNGKIYKVPQFQRDYSWSRDNWEDLWNDISIVKNTGNPHYMGSVVLQDTGEKQFLIIDGQQRFTTLSILTLAFIARIQELADLGIDVEANQERVNILMRQYIGQKDPASLRYSSKIFLNENNDGFYQQRLLAFKPPINVAKLSDSEKLMWESYGFFLRNIQKEYENYSGEQLANVLNKVIGDLLMFIQITVEDELNAYTVFETLNSRGVELTSTDLLKNFLFSLVAKSSTDLNHVKNQWKKIIDTIGLKEFPIFLRYYLQGTKQMVTKESLFKVVKQYAKTNQDVFELLDHLESYAYTYTALGAPDDEIWSTDKELRGYITALKIFRVTQWKPLAMVAYEKLPSTDFKKLICSIVVISYRYNLIAKLQTNEMEKIYSRAGINLYKSNQPNYTLALNDIKALYLNDDEFKNYFQIKQFRTNNSTDKKQVRYTLYKLEAQESGNLYDFELDSGTIEHILPESFSEPWREVFTEDDYERNIYLLGNLTLLETSKNNKHAADNNFDTKKEIYKDSKYVLTNKINYNSWSPNSVKHRQAYLAKLATSVWKI
ncbi:DUF262 domain-containing HNH endonuclease family protein [Mucilaginibacter sp. RS28]|uniref:DUF262 domain-containing HNH endonuclease family protein n=1 Tax=Mucilaginibacter straminoryzae TaxID=2932774 RepID=A0A9X1X299_9SPHI|nr:DUF262 domain-containing protein [Mucilaginibacter straminoryzae]MCJ8208228.1 DUF262 domain-containing HNH endonuclease family protein [Mucilaginibacter straminoryzae]